jgi:hypothetical protein
LLASCAIGLKSDAPDPIQPRRFAREPPQPLDPDPTVSDRVNPVSQVNPPPALAFLQKSPWIFFIYKNTLPPYKIPYSLVLFLYLSPKPFQIFAD